MKKLILLLAALLMMGLSPLSFSAGGPMNEDLSPLIPLAEKAIEAGKQGDATAFLEASTQLMEEAKGHPISAKQQRILTRARIGIAKGKAGKLDEATESIQDALSNMVKTAGPKFGGGS